MRKDDTVTTETTGIDISGLDKAELLAALYNRAAPQGLGFLHYNPEPMTAEQAQQEIDRREGAWKFDFDYLNGRSMKVDITGDTICDNDARLFDRDNGTGACEGAVRSVREGTPLDTAGQEMAVKNAARAAKRGLSDSESVEVHGNLRVLRMGMADVADQVRPAVEKYVEKE
jgi:hypothetical protein